MAATDITAKDTRINGVHSYEALLRSEAHLIDGEAYSGILTVATHDLFTIPAGNALVGLTIVSLDTATSGGSATATFKLKVGDSTAEALGSAIAVANLAAGDVAKILTSGIKGYEDGKESVVELTVGTAAFTKLKLLVIADFLPVSQMLTNG